MCSGSRACASTPTPYSQSYKHEGAGSGGARLGGVLPRGLPLHHRSTTREVAGSHNWFWSFSCDAQGCRQHAAVRCASAPIPLVTHSPINVPVSPARPPEGNVLVRRPGGEAQHAGGVVGTLRVPLHLIGGRHLLVDQVVVQDVKLVALHHLGWRVVVVVVRLVILVPLVAYGGGRGAGLGEGVRGSKVRGHS